jgi:hypothetical protein
MEPLDDHDLKELVPAWKAPDAPEHLHRRVFGPPHPSWWAWLFTGNVRVPVPACAAIVLLLAWLAFDRQPSVPTVATPSSSIETVTLADFRPPAEIEVKLVGALP